MTTTFEQFREQCTDALFESKKQTAPFIMDLHDSGWNAALDEAIRVINSLPLPVMPEQAEPVAESTVREKFEAWADGKGMLDTSQDEKGDYFPIMTRGAWHAWKARETESSALLARIAALEAEIDILRGN